MMMHSRFISPIIAVVILISLSVVGVLSIKFISSTFERKIEEGMNVVSLSKSYDILNGFVDEDNTVYLLVYFPEEIDLKKEKLGLILRGDKSGKIFKTCITANEKVAEKEKCYLCLNCKKPIKGRYMLKLDDYFLECDLYSVFNVTKEMIEFISPRYITKGVIKLALYPLDFTPIIRREIFFDWWNITDEGIDFSSVPWMVKYAMYRVWYKVNVTGPTNDITIYFRIPDEVLEKITEYCSCIGDDSCDTAYFVRVFELNTSDYSQTYINYDNVSFVGSYSNHGITIPEGFIVYFSNISKGLHYFTAYFQFYFYYDMESFGVGTLLNEVGDSTGKLYVVHRSVSEYSCDYNSYYFKIDLSNLYNFGTKSLLSYIYHEASAGSCKTWQGVCFNVSLKFNKSILTYLEYYAKYTFTSTADEEDRDKEAGIVLVLNYSNDLKSFIICNVGDCNKIEGKVDNLWELLGISKDSIGSDGVTHREFYNLNKILGSYIDNISSLEKLCVFTYMYNEYGDGTFDFWIDNIKIVTSLSTDFFK